MKKKFLLLLITTLITANILACGTDYSSDERERDRYEEDDDKASNKKDKDSDDKDKDSKKDKKDKKESS